MMKIKMQQDLMKDHDINRLYKAKNFDMFWGEWLKGKGGESSEGGSRNAWEGWLREKGLLPSDDMPQETHGWSDPVDLDDLSEWEDDASFSTGMKRAGERNSEDFSSEEGMEDDYDDDDDQGGEMMPLPSAM